jgi:hypothetical protein
MTKIISLFLFLFLTLNFCIAQDDEKYYLNKDLSSYFYFSTLNNQIVLFQLNNKDYSSFYYYNSISNEFYFNEIWEGNNIYIDKFGGYKHSVTENLEIEDKPVSFQTNKIFPQWIIFIFLISLVVLAWTNFFYTKYLLELFRTFFNYRAAIKLFNESNILIGRSAFAIVINFFIIFSLNIFLIISYYNITTLHPIILYLISFVIILAGNLLNNNKTARLYNFNIRLYNQVLGILLTPMLILFTYIDLNFKELILYINIIIIILVYFARLIRCIKIFFQEHFSIFYLFLYLCIIEFLPIYIFIKVYNNVLM